MSGTELSLRDSDSLEIKYVSLTDILFNICLVIGDLVIEREKQDLIEEIADDLPAEDAIPEEEDDDEEKKEDKNNNKPKVLEDSIIEITAENIK